MIKAPLNLAMLGDPAAEQFCEILGLADTFSPLADDGCIPAPSFSYFAYDAATYELDGTLASGRVAVINVPDADGVYRQVATTKVAYVGARHSGGKQYADNGSGVLLDPQPYALSAPELTNRISIYDTWAALSATANIGTGTRTISGPGIFGAADQGAILTDTGAGDVAKFRFTQAIAGNNSATCQIAWIRKDADTSRFIAFYAYMSGGSTSITALVQFNTATGASVVIIATDCTVTAGTRAESIGGVDYWRCAMRAVPNGAYNNTTSRCDILPAHSTVWGAGGTGVNAAQGSVHGAFNMVTSGQTLENALICLPVTGLASRDKDVIAAPLANLNQPSNSGYIEVNVATGSTPNILGAFLSFDGTNYKLNDGTTTVSVAGTVGEHRLGWYAGSGVMNLCVDGTWGTEAAYDGTLAAALGVFTDATYVQGIRNWKLWASASQAAIDERMAA